MKTIAIAFAALVIAGCSSPTGVRTTIGEPTGTPAAFTVTSPDFTDGGELADWTTASAFAGQCVGDNLNPAIEWSDAPVGTKAFAITLIDRSANNFIHWVHFDIPGDADGVPKGGADTLGGVEGDKSSNGADADGYFGPCPPSPDHRYEFTVYALDEPLGLAKGADFVSVKTAIDAHELAEASISGMRSGPAGG